MLAVGHLAIGYLLGRGTSKLAGVNVNLPLLFVASVLPDIDMLFPIPHRGPTHSIILLTLVVLPFLLYYRKRALPYYAALLSHSLIGDLVTEGSALLWPLQDNFIGSTILTMGSLEVSIAEAGVFFASLVVLFRVGDFGRLLKSGFSSLLLTIPMVALLAPLIIKGNYLINPTPTLLIIPSLMYISLLSIAILSGFYFSFKKTKKPGFCDQRT